MILSASVLCVTSVLLVIGLALGAAVGPAVPGAAGLGSIAVSPSCRECVVANIPGSVWQSLAFDPDNQLLFGVGGPSDDLGIIDTTSNSLEKKVQLDGQQTNVVYDHVNRELYVTEGSVSRTGVLVLNATTDRTVSFVNLSDPSVMAVDTRTGNVLVVNDSWVVVLNSSTNAVLGSLYTNGWHSLPAGAQFGATYDPSCACFYVGGTPDVVGYRDSGGQPYVESVAPMGSAWYPVYDGVNGLIYSVDEYYGNVSVVDPANDRLVANVATGTDPVSAAVDTFNGFIYVANWGVQNSNYSGVTILNGSSNTVIAHIPMDAVIGGIAFDSLNGDVYVANSSYSSLYTGVAVLSPISPQGPPPTSNPLNWTPLGFSLGQWLVAMAVAAAVAAVGVILVARSRRKDRRKTMRRVEGAEPPWVT